MAKTFTSKQFIIDRKDLINHHISELLMMTSIDKIREDIIKSGEFIITAEDILASLDSIPGPLVGQVEAVKPEQCKIVYKF